MNRLTADQLKKELDGNPSLRLVDVRLPEDYETAHIPGAINACVFPVSFLSDLQKAGVSKSDSIGVYGASEDSFESRMAADKLSRDGFENVKEFREGLKGWQAAGHGVEGKGRQEQPPVLNGTYSLDLTESRVEWTGRNLLNKHSGTVALKSGHLSYENNRLTGGEFVIDLRSMTCTDIQDSKTAQVLIDHLQSDDFFDVERFPEAQYVIESVEVLPGATPGSPNVRVTGRLTLKGEVSPLAITAMMGRNGDKPAGQASFSFDRTQWKVLYGSGKFFENVGMNLVNDWVDIQVRLLGA